MFGARRFYVGELIFLLTDLGGQSIALFLLFGLAVYGEGDGRWACVVLRSVVGFFRCGVDESLLWHTDGCEAGHDARFVYEIDEYN